MSAEPVQSTDHPSDVDYDEAEGVGGASLRPQDGGKWEEERVGVVGRREERVGIEDVEGAGVLEVEEGGNEKMEEGACAEKGDSGCGKEEEVFSDINLATPRSELEFFDYNVTSSDSSGAQATLYSHSHPCWLAHWQQYSLV